MKKQGKKYKFWKWHDEDDVNAKPMVTDGNSVSKDMLIGLKKEVTELKI